MATTEPYLEITDGVTSVKLMDNLAITDLLKKAMPYRLSFGTWAPKVAQRNKNEFGFPYLPVLEEMTIDIKGTTPDNCYTKLQQLNTLLDQGERWLNNEIVTVVLVKYQPKGSNLATFMQDVCIGGYASDSMATIEVAQDFNYGAEVSFLKGVKLKFWRRNGLWISSSETKTAAAAAMGTVLVPTAFTVASPQLAPIDIGFAVNSPGTQKGTSNHPNGVVITAQKSAYIAIYEGAAGTTALSLSGTASTADATAQATNGVVGRVGLTTADTSVTGAGTGSFDEVEYCAVYASFRLAASNTAIAHLEISFNSSNVTDITLPEVSIPYNGGLPQVIFLGIFPTDAVKYTQISLFMRCTATTVNIDIDEMVVVGVNRATNILTLPDITALGGAGLNQVVQGRLLTRPNPLVAFPAAGAPIKYSYNGSPYFFVGNSTTTTFAMCLIIVQDIYWQPVTASNVAQTLSMSVTRYLSHLTPE